MDHLEFTLGLHTLHHRSLRALSKTLDYGDGVVITRLEGKGNGTNDIDISSESEAILLSNSTGRISELVYAQNGSPVNIRIVDPLMVPDAEFELIVNASDSDLEEGDEVNWVLINKTLLEAGEDSLKYIRHFKQKRSMF